MKYLFVFIFLFANSFADQTAITINNKKYSDSFFYEKYSKEDWEKATEQNKSRMINDFIRRKVFAEEAIGLNLPLDPKVNVDIFNQKNRLLVNHSYEVYVAKPLITKELLEQTQKNIQRDLLVHHILIGYAGCRLQKKIDRSDQEALNLANNIYQKFISGETFEDLALKFSDDRSVTSNNGKLGWLYWGQTVQEFQEKAFSLELNQLSKPVRTDYGYHLILVSEERESEQYKNIDPSMDGYDDFIRQTARISINSKLQPAAQEYDIRTIKDYGVVFDQDMLDKIYSAIEKTQKKNKITGNPNIDLVSVLENIDVSGPVCVIQGKGFGVKWFADKLSRQPMSRRPRITSAESLESVFNITVLQDIAVRKAMKDHLDEDKEFLSQFDGYETAILYEAYKKYLDENIPEIDPVRIEEYYDKNKDLEFSEGEKVSVRELRVTTESLADSLSSLIHDENDFIRFAGEYSLINPDDGGKKPPFVKGKYATLGEKAFTMNIGEISLPFENLDHSWSILMLLDKLPPGYIPLDKVNNKIATILTREDKNTIKDRKFEELKIKYDVVVEPDFYQFESVETDNPQK